MVRYQLIEVFEDFDFDALRLKHLFSFTVDEAVSFLVNVGALKNEMKCNKCEKQMKIQKNKKVIDGIQVYYCFKI
jgi:hypothetical protein